MKKLWVVLTICLMISFLACGAQNQNAANSEGESEQAGQDDRRARMQEELAKIKYDVPDEIDINYPSAGKAVTSSYYRKRNDCE